MNRTAWLQDRRMAKFCDVLSRWKARELSAQEAGEILGCSERQFRRYRRRHEEEGLTGLFDKRRQSDVGAIGVPHALHRLDGQAFLRPCAQAA
jgi:hypothetical protein